MYHEEKGKKCIQIFGIPEGKRPPVKLNVDERIKFALGSSL
jgi:hypothetical protein